MNHIYDSKMPFEEKNFLKRVIKKIVRKSVLFLFKPYIDFQNEVNQYNTDYNKTFQKNMEEMSKRYESILKRNDSLELCIKKLEEKNIRYEAHISKMREDMGAVSRQLMRVKWKQIDDQRKMIEKDNDVLLCDICGYSDIRSNYEVMETECIFNGGRLERYVCPGCGVIFGPSKFAALGQDGINEDYWVHYLGFKEGDSTHKEIRAFKMLNPSKEKIYLNYGCGSWSKSVELLREEGYQVYGYEPYAADIDNPYIIAGKENIKKMRFDGIFSNDLLEHLINPIEDLKFMKSLLLGADALMAHSTGCYEYVHEITRFHTHFFTGKSAQIMADKAGLDIIERCDDLTENDFICCVFKNKEKNAGKMDCMPLMHSNNPQNITTQGIYIPQNEVAYGPYLTIRKGNYLLYYELDGEVDSFKDVMLRVTANCGRLTIFETCLEEMSGVKSLSLDQMFEKLEFVFDNKSTMQMILKELYLCPEECY